MLNFTVSAHTLTSKQLPPLPPPSFILNLTTVTLSIITFQTVNLTGSNRSKTVLLELLLRLLNPLISLPFSISPLVNERIEYKLISLTYKVLTTAQPSYLHNLISFQPPRSTRSSPVVTFSRPQTISSLKIAWSLFNCNWLTVCFFLFLSMLVAMALCF